MIDTVFGIKVRMSRLCINRYRPIIGRLLDADGYCLIGASLLLTCKNRLPYNLYCVGGDVKHYSINPIQRLNGERLQ